MPIDVSLLRAQVNAFAESYDKNRERREDVLRNLLRPLQPDYSSGDALLATCLAATQVQGMRWSGALFKDGEPTNGRFAFGAVPKSYALIATDGSQILPDRHKPHQFAYVQAGCACVTYGTSDQSFGKALQRIKRARLIPEYELYDEQSGELRPPSEISNQRDALEIELMADACCMAREAGLQPIAIADGSIVPFALLGGRNVKLQATKLLPPVARALDAMRASGAWVCGYIDKPNSNAIARACALDGTTYDAISESLLKMNDGRIAGIVDRHLMERALPATKRTALFDPNWEVNDLLHDHAMRACYVNFGSGLGRGAVIGRIEVPMWGVPHVGDLAAVLQRHANMGEGYPLILKAAHQESVVSKEDAAQIEASIGQALLARGVLPHGSFKQEAKDKG
jgi:hypothetical protein